MYVLVELDSLNFIVRVTFWRDSSTRDWSSELLDGVRGRCRGIMGESYWDSTFIPILSFRFAFCAFAGVTFFLKFRSVHGRAKFRAVKTLHQKSHNSCLG